MEADRIFINGMIHTMKGEKDTDIVQAVAIKDGRIAAVGTDDAILAAYSADKDSITDLGKKTVIPGMEDTHMHLWIDFMNRKKRDLSSAKSFDEIKYALKQHMGTLRPGEWLQGSRLHMERLKEGRFPDKNDLDEISTDIPIVVKSFCEHAAVLNSKALELTGIDRNFTPDIPGTVEHFADGEPSGIIREETYQYYVDSKIPIPSFDDAVDDIDKYLAYCASVGLTTMHTNAINEPYNIELFQAVEKKHGMKSRVIYYPTNLPKTSTGAVTGFGNDKIKLGACKMFMDGSVGAASSAMYDRYADKDTTGLLVMDQETANRRVKEAYDAGMDVAVHAIGDKAIDMILTAFENAYDSSKGWNQRFYLIHGYIPRPESYERMKKLPLVVVSQPVFIRNFVGMALPRLGEERYNRLFPMRDFIDNGIICTSSSDACVQEINPFYGIQCCVTRKALCENDEVIAPKQAISVYEAVETYTKFASYVIGEENIKGTIEPGKLADMVVLDRDIFAIDPDEIYLTKVILTVLGGKDVYAG